MIKAEPAKITGHNLKGRKFILKPVKRDKTDRIKSITIIAIKRIFCIGNPFHVNNSFVIIRDIAKSPDDGTGWKKMGDAPDGKE
jgi:hypothetical protein